MLFRPSVFKFGIFLKVAFTESRFVLALGPVSSSDLVFRFLTHSEFRYLLSDSIFYFTIVLFSPLALLLFTPLRVFKPVLADGISQESRGQS